MDQSFTLAKGLRLNLGCGPVQPDGWVNIDGSNRAHLACKLNWLDNLLVKLKLIPPTEFNKSTQYQDLFKGLSYQDNSVAIIYAGELLEHFEYQDAFNLTRECFRVLKPNGVLRVCVPDGPSFWGKYLALYNAELAKPHDMQDVEALKGHIQLFFNDICTKKTHLGSMGHTHKWNFDEVQLVDMLEAAGFSNVERMPYRKSRITDICNIERSDFLIVEGVK